jgi:hypothetical protein
VYHNHGHMAGLSGSTPPVLPFLDKTCRCTCARKQAVVS